MGIFSVLGNPASELGNEEFFLVSAVSLVIFVCAASVIEAKSGSGSCSISIDDSGASGSYIVRISIVERMLAKHHVVSILI